MQVCVVLVFHQMETVQSSTQLLLVLERQHGDPFSTNRGSAYSTNYMRNVPNYYWVVFPSMLSKIMSFCVGIVFYAKNIIRIGSSTQNHYSYDLSLGSCGVIISVMLPQRA